MQLPNYNRLHNFLNYASQNVVAIQAYQSISSLKTNQLHKTYACYKTVVMQWRMQGHLFFIFGLCHLNTDEKCFMTTRTFDTTVKKKCGVIVQRAPVQIQAEYARCHPNDSCCECSNTQHTRVHWALQCAGFGNVTSGEVSMLVIKYEKEFSHNFHIYTVYLDIIEILCTN